MPAPRLSGPQACFMPAGRAQPAMKMQQPVRDAAEQCHEIAIFLLPEKIFILRDDHHLCNRFLTEGAKYFPAAAQALVAPSNTTVTPKQIQ